MDNVIIITIESCCNHLQSVYPSVEAFKQGLEHDSCDRAFMFEIGNGELNMVKEFCPSEINSLRDELVEDTEPKVDDKLSELIKLAVAFDSEVLADEIYRFLDGDK